MAENRGDPFPTSSSHRAPGSGGRSRRAKRSWKSRLLLAFVILAILVVATELILRSVFGLGHPLLYVADAGCGYLPAPNQHLHRFFAHNDINAQSMRSDPIQTSKPADGIRILFVGDSVTYGQTFTDQPKIFTSILGRELPGQLHRPVEILNASAGAWAVGNELGYIRSRGIFSADLVVFVVNTYDMTQAFNDTSLGTDIAYADHNPPCAIAETWTRYIKPRLFHKVGRRSRLIDANQERLAGYPRHHAPDRSRPRTGCEK